MKHFPKLMTRAEQINQELMEASEMNPGLVKIGDDFVSAVSGLLNPRANAYEQ